MPFLSDQKNWRATRSPPTPLLSESSDQYFETAILFSIVERPNNYTFGDIMTLPQPLRKSCLSYKICPLFTHSICYWEVCTYFLEEGVELSVDRTFHRDDYPWEGSFPEANFSGEILN